MRLNSVYPIVEGYKAYTAPGVRFDLSDPVGLHALNFALSYSGQRNVPDDERFHLRFDYKHHPWNLWGAWNRADFYDLFGPTKVSRKGYQLGLGYKGYLVDEAPRTLRYDLSLARYWGLEVLPEFQNVPDLVRQFPDLRGEHQLLDGPGHHRRNRGGKGFHDRD